MTGSGRMDDAAGARVKEEVGWYGMEMRRVRRGARRGLPGAGGLGARRWAGWSMMCDRSRFMDGAAGAGGLKAAMGGMVNDVGSRDDAGLGMARGQGGAQGGRRAFFSSVFL